MEFLDVIVPIFPMCGLLILVMLIGIGFNYFWLKFMLRNIRTCPECGAKGAAEIQNTEEIVLSNSVDRRGRKPIRVKETKYIDHYQCSVCAHTWTRTFTQKERFKMDDLNSRQNQSQGRER